MTISRLKQQIESENVHHAYIFEGPLTADKEEEARAFASALVCKKKPGDGCGTCPDCRNIKNDNHIDVKLYRAEQSGASDVRSIRDADIERMISELMKKPVSADRNIAIIADADLMTMRAQNRLLKTLEEPPYGTVMILLSENVNDLLETIRSRCMHIRVLPVNTDSPAYGKEARELVLILSGQGGYVHAKKIIEKIEKNKEDAYLFLDSLEDVYRDELIKISGGVKREQIFKAAGEIEKARDKIKRGINVQYTLKGMVLAIGG